MIKTYATWTSGAGVTHPPAPAVAVALTCLFTFFFILFNFLSKHMQKGSASTTLHNLQRVPQRAPLCKPERHPAAIIKITLNRFCLCSIWATTRAVACFSSRKGGSWAARGCAGSRCTWQMCTAMATTSCHTRCVLQFTFILCCVFAPFCAWQACNATAAVQGACCCCFLLSLKSLNFVLVDTCDRFKRHRLAYNLNLI